MRHFPLPMQAGSRIGTPSFLWLTLALPLLLLIPTGCDAQLAGQKVISLADARRGYTTHLLKQTKMPDPIPQPPAGFELVHYAAPLGSFPAYVATVPPSVTTGTKHPAIVWIAGGFDNGIGDTPWTPATPDNDQSARAFPKAGIVTMYPSLRGGNNNPGYLEGEYGEVDDVIAAARYLASRADVDPTRIYLGGHSTGGTLALLVAESNGQFRAVFAFGPVSSVANYGQEDLPFDVADKNEVYLRSPILYLKAITRPTFVMEGTDGNHDSLHKMAAYNTNPLVHFYDLPGLTHFSELAPATPVIARQILADTGPEAHIDFATYGRYIVPVRQ